jgi:gliding motility-associated-like protein
VLQPTQLRANGGLKYNWSSKTVSISCTSCQNPWVRIAEKAAFKVRVFDDIGCFADDSVEFSTKPLPVVIAGPDTAICPSKEAFLYASGAKDYKWLPSNLVNCERCAFTIGKPFTTTIFTVIGTAENGCENSDSTIVSIKPLPNANAGPDSLICYGASAFLHASGGVSYEWSPTNLVPCVKCKTNFVTPTSLTNYYVMVKGANGCFKSDTVSINVRSLRAPKARFEANHPRCAPGKSVFRGELYDYDTICKGEVEWLWDFGDGNFARIANPTHIYESPGEFSVTVNVKNAESYQANVSILHPDSCLKNIYIPNTFTPNKDGQNDLLYVRGINITKLLFRLYNSWGEEIYRTTSLKEGWDGTYKGKVLSTQTFVFTCDATFYDGSTVFKTGNITLNKGFFIN